MFGRRKKAPLEASPLAQLRHINIDPHPSRPAAQSTLPAHFTELLKVEAGVGADFIPRNAKAGKWEDHHEFHRSATPPNRNSFGLNVPDPPIALICPECDVRLPTDFLERGFGSRLTTRACTYCGVTMTVHGTRLMWWRA